MRTSETRRVSHYHTALPQPDHHRYPTLASSNCRESPQSSVTQRHLGISTKAQQSLHHQQARPTSQHRQPAGRHPNEAAKPALPQRHGPIPPRAPQPISTSSKPLPLRLQQYRPPLRRTSPPPPPWHRPLLTPQSTTTQRTFPLQHQRTREQRRQPPIGPCSPGTSRRTRRPWSGRRNMPSGRFRPSISRTCPPL